MLWYTQASIPELKFIGKYDAINKIYILSITQYHRIEIISGKKVSISYSNNCWVIS